MHRAWVRDGYEVSVVSGWVHTESWAHVNVSQKLMIWTWSYRLRPMRTASHEARGGRGGEAPGGHLPPREVARAGGAQSARLLHNGFILDPILVPCFY